MDERREEDGPRIAHWLDYWAGMAQEEVFTESQLRGFLSDLELGRWLDDELICPRRRVKFTAEERLRLERICCTMIEKMGGTFDHGQVRHTVRDGRMRRTVV